MSQDSDTRQPWCYETLVSVGMSAIRTWSVYLTRDFGDKRYLKNYADWSVVLQPLLTITLNVAPMEYFCFLDNQLCATTNLGEVLLFNLHPEDQTKMLIKVKSCRW